MTSPESKTHVTLSDIAHGIESVEQEAVKFVKTLTWNQIEAWQKDNEYILSGYRRYERFV